MPKRVRALGNHTAEANQYSASAKQMAEKWQVLAIDGDHYKLAFDTPGSWSQKYNLVWDKLLNLNLFPAKVHNTELDFYLKHLNQYGLPLDSRADYTKLDWEIWTATLADNSTQFAELLAPITKWVNETPTRVPLTDWYDTKNGKQIGFQARSVVGGIYIKALHPTQRSRRNGSSAPINEQRNRCEQLSCRSRSIRLQIRRHHILRGNARLLEAVNAPARVHPKMNWLGAWLRVSEAIPGSAVARWVAVVTDSNHFSTRSANDPHSHFRINALKIVSDVKWFFSLLCR